MTVEAYYPDPLPPEEIDEEQFRQLARESSIELSRFDGMIRHCENKASVLAFLRAEEAICSLFLGIRKLKFEEHLNKLLTDDYVADDFKEIRFLLNYYKEAKQRVAEKGFTLDVLYEFQEKLYQHRMKRWLSQDKLYRERLPWLIVFNSDEFDMRLHTHPNEDRLDQLFDNLAQFIRESEFSPLVTAAIAYGQLVMIHPWRYANWRTTGVFVPYLFNFLGLTREREFYISKILSQKRDQFYELIYNVFENQKWEDWIKFFIQQVKIKAEKDQQKVDHILEFNQQFRNELIESTNSWKIHRVKKHLMKHPIFSKSDIYSRYGLSRGCVNNFVNTLEEKGYLLTDGRKQYVNFIIAELIEIIES